ILESPLRQTAIERRLPALEAGGDPPAASGLLAFVPFAGAAAEPGAGAAAQALAAAVRTRLSFDLVESQHRSSKNIRLPPADQVSETTSTRWITFLIMPLTEGVFSRV